MWFLTLLCGILCIMYPVSGELDKQCVDTCKCCIDEKCGPQYEWDNVCKIGCIDGHRGARCYDLCKYKNCKNCGGGSLSNACTMCYDGYYLGPNKNCTSECPYNCKSCNSSTMCTECKEGFYDKDGSTTCKYAHCPANCECNGQYDCVSCKKGYYDTPTACTKLCPVSCLTCESEESCNECKDGFYNGYDHDIKTNPQQNTCTSACGESCAQCQSYNNCLQCVKGKYGSTCQKDCSVGCKNNTCLIDSGLCECTINFSGDKCMKCVNGKYGLHCNITCPKYCKGHICDRSSGDCIDGCINENITGDTCNKCKDGMFGELCYIMCPKNCRTDGCARYSGLCSNGCIGNFNGTTCDQCVHAKYGSNCELDCPVNCVDSVCERSAGTCYDCIGKFQGKTCDVCNVGYYGPLCNEQCSQYCNNSSCYRETGKCSYGCTYDYSGDRCCVKSNHCEVCYSNTECLKCEPGFFRHMCTKRCPHDCLGSCDISTGKCDDDDGAEKPFATAILGALFAVSVVIITAQNLFLLITKRRKATKREESRQAADVTYENQLKCVAPHFSEDKESNTVSAGKTTVYEEINRAYDKDHEYQQISPT